MSAGLKAGVGHVDLEPRLAKDFERQVSKQIGDPIAREATRSGNRFAGVFGKVAVAAGGLFAAKVGVDFFRGAIDGASDLNETVSKARTIFGPAAADLEKWASGADKALGQSKQQALDFAGTFGNLFTQLGIGSEQAAGMSTAMVELGSDFASFHNADVTEVLNAQTAAFRGEYDALQRFVPTINAAAVEQEALRATGKKTTKELTAQEKALATQTLMLEGAGSAAGDFARTSDGLANKQRIASAQMDNLKARIGQGLLPIMTKLVGFASDRLIPAIERIGDMAGQVFDIIFKGDFTKGPFSEDSKFVDTLFDVREGFMRFVDYLKENVLPIVQEVVGWVRDHLTIVLVGLAAIVLALVAPLVLLAAELVFLYKKFEIVRTVVDGVVDFFLTTVVPAVAAFAKGVADQFSNLVGWVKKHWAAISEAVGHVVRAIKEIIGVFIDFVMALWRAWGDDLARIAKTVWETIKALVKAGVDFVRSIIEGVLALINGDWGKAWNALKSAAKAVWDGIVAVVKGQIEVVKSVIGGVLSTIGQLWSGGWDKVKGTLGSAWNSIRDTVSNGIGDVVDFARRLPGRIFEALSGLPAKMIQLGKDLIEGMKNGITGAAGGLLKAVKDTVTAPFNWIKVESPWRFGSPSKTMRQFGVWAVQGFIDGVIASEGRLGATVQEVMGGALEQARGILSGLGAISAVGDARTGLASAQRNARDLASKREDLIASIGSQLRKVTALERASADVTVEENLRILEAKKDLETKTADLQDLEEQGMRDSLDWQIARANVELAEDALAQARTDSTAKTAELLSAEEDLKRLRDELTATNEALARSDDEIKAAQTGVIEAQVGLLESSQSLIALSPAFVDFFAGIARDAGMSEDAIAALMARVDAARNAAVDLQNSVGATTGLGIGDRNRTPSGSVRKELEKIATYVGEKWSAGKLDRLVEQISKGQTTIDDIVESVAKRVQKRAMGGPTSGLTLVGERGPELLATGPARVHSNDDLVKMMGNDRPSKTYQLNLSGPFANDVVDLEEQFRRMEILSGSTP